MANRLISSDDELMEIYRTLFSELRAKAAEGKCVIFPPEKILIPAVESTGYSLSVRMRGEKDTGFSFECVEANIDTGESLHLLGATLYHLVAGKSEFNRESFLLDGYCKPLTSGLWPIISGLLKGKEQDIEKIAVVAGLVNPAQTSPVQADSVQSIRPVAGKFKPVDLTLRELASKGMKIVGHNEVANFWGIAVPHDIRIRYSQAVLDEAIKENQNGEQWVLAYYTGQSLYQMERKLGSDTRKQPCFWRLNQEWLRGKEKYWATKELEGGYYLLNFNGKFGGQDWETQNLTINKLGTTYERADEAIVTETILSNFIISNGERLLEDWSHLGNRFRIGSFGESGIVVVVQPARNSDNEFRVVIARKFDR